MGNVPGDRRLRRGFTLLELLTIVGIIGVMATVAVMGLNKGRGAARMKGASRDIFASVRHARSSALVTQQPAIITYKEAMVDGEICAKIEITSARLMNAAGPRLAETIAGDVVALYEADEGEETGGGEGLSSEDFFFSPISDEVVKGIRIKVTKGEEKLETGRRRDEGYRPAISVFSNVDYLLGRFKEEKNAQQDGQTDAQEEKTERPAAPAASATSASPDDLQEEVSIVWEVNGRCEPHTVWIYREGEDPDSGICIKVDRFGGAKIVSADDV